MSGLPRTVIKWLQGLDLTFPYTNPKWDFSNGFLVAEMLSRYFPHEIKTCSFNTGSSLQAKMGNWSLIKKFIVKHNLDVSLELIDGTMHCKEGAALLLIENIFQVLTKRPIQKPQAPYEIDLTDWPYQQQLPFHARATAVQAIRNNLKNSEIETDPNMHFIKKKAETIIDTHTERRKEERDMDPLRFNRKPTVAELCLKRPADRPSTDSDPKSTADDSDSFSYGIIDNKKQNNALKSETNFTTQTDKNSVTINDNKSFKEIRVKQDAYSFSLGTVN